MLKKKKYNYLFDITSVLPNSKIQVLNESVVEGSIPKVIFKARLQTAEEKNQNGRVYSRRVCESIVNQLHDKAVNRSLLMEVDHPSVAGGSAKSLERRSVTVE